MVPAALRAEGSRRVQTTQNVSITTVALSEAQAHTVAYVGCGGLNQRYLQLWSARVEALRTTRTSAP